MKRKVAAVIVAVALIGLGVAVAIGGSGEDPLVAKSYLEDTFPSVLAQNLEKRASNGTKAAYEKAVGKLDKAGEADAKEAESFSGNTSGYSTKTVNSGDVLTLNHGSSMVIYGGAGTVTDGTLMDVTAGKSTGKDGAVTVGHRYIVTDTNGATVRVDTAGSFGVQGTVSVTVGSGQSGQSGDSALPFGDVKSGDWYYSAVEYVYEKGYFSGTAANVFSPNTPMTRAMVATVLYRVSGEKAPNGASAFRDVPGGQWYSDGIAWANAHGIVNGMGDGTFGPDRAVTREELVTMMYRYQSYRKGNLRAKGSLAGYPDGDIVSDWAKTAVEWATGAELIRGRDTGRLDPKGNATRAEVATILQRFEGLK